MQQEYKLNSLFGVPQTGYLREKLDFCFAMKKSHLTLEQRYQIQAWLAVGTKQKEIASLIGKDKNRLLVEKYSEINALEVVILLSMLKRSVRFGKNALNGLESSQVR